MGNCATSNVTRLLGEDGLDGGCLVSHKGDLVDFLAPYEKQANYMKYCSNIVPSLNPTSIINEYTNHTTEHYARVNLSLAADSNGLHKYSEYIPQLKSAIMSKPLLDDGYVYRGVELSDEEIEHMERLGSFFIPSFTSTSIDPSKAYERSSTMVIKLPYACKYACSITEDLSPFYNDEREVLISCYSAFRLERIEYENKSKRILLYLDEHLSCLPSLI